MTGPGRPAGPTTETQIVVLTAALKLLLDEGATALTAQRLHGATGVSRSTIYRHWPTPHAFLEALIDVAPDSPQPLSGELATDLRQEVEALCRRLRDRPVGAFLQALVVASSSDPEAGALRHRYLDDLLSPFYAVLDAGGITSIQDRDDAVSAIVSPLLLDALLFDRPPGRTSALRTVDEVVARLTSP